MREFYRKYTALREKRSKQYLNEKWPLIRENGRTSFTIKKSFLYAFSSALFIYCCNVIFVGEKFTVSGIIAGLIVGFMTGLLVADGEWAKNEARYLKKHNSNETDQA